MLKNAQIVPYIPVADVARARKFYEEKVGLNHGGRAPSARFDPKALDGAALVADLIGYGRGGRTMPDLSDLRHGCHPPARL